MTTGFKYCLLIVFSVFTINTLAQTPHVSIQSVNSQTIGLYEKFEINAELSNVNFSNPYDPVQVDLSAIFTSPSGKEWRIYGFYDNYQNRNQWKVRFAANELGQWRYVLLLKTPAGEGQSPVATFNVTDSEYHGWIRVSPVNPHYFIHDDGAPYYAIGPYFPWGVNISSINGLAKLQTSGCNFWGYWNIMYDTGEIIESMDSGLGRYDQPKCGWIDQLIDWSEDRGLKMMLAIWPHDLLSNTVWAHQWHQNPYNTICSVEEFFASEEAWEYQEKQYRYLIARWGYSRALAIWEIVNEVNGTDGWQMGKENEARRWIGKVHDYLTENDPHGRPTTASQSGGIYWPQGYEEIDVPNVHVYETSWSAEYLGNPLRSSAYNYYKLANQFWHDFEKPAIFGEAGYTDSYGDFRAGSDDYTAWFHNALWASWAGGMAATPVWWSFTSRNLMTDDVMGQMLSFSQIARDYDYACENFEPYEIISEDCDVYAMRSDSSLFGWARDIYGISVDGRILHFPALKDTSYQIIWYNTWTAEIIDQSFAVGVDSLVTLSAPETVSRIPDAAFFAKQTAEGILPAKIHLSTATNNIYIKRNEQAKILCTIHDAEGRFVRTADNLVQFKVEGPGFLLTEEQINATAGVVRTIFTADANSGHAQIIATSPGLIADTLAIDVSSRIWVDNFEEYESMAELGYNWFARPGTSAELALADGIANEPGISLKVDYNIGVGHAPYAGVFKKIADDFSMSEYLEFWLKGDASNNTLAILIFDKNGGYWQFDYSLSGSEAEFLSIPLQSFFASATDSILDLAFVDEISFNILKGDGEAQSGTVYLDDITFSIEVNETGVHDNDKENPFADLHLGQNYPNPFAASTNIVYEIRSADHVRLEVFNILGQKVKTLVNEYKHAGIYKVTVDSSNLASGHYTYVLKTSSGTKKRRMILVR
ncbi:DUF5060 domain-containing protein [candidate division KSB1 bacterium]|nr:DUF5060 domain-containing protein [candidate division KSB1 bacterium]